MSLFICEIPYKLQDRSLGNHQILVLIRNSFKENKSNPVQFLEWVQSSITLGDLLLPAEEVY